MLGSKLFDIPSYIYIQPFFYFKYSSSYSNYVKEILFASKCHCDSHLHCKTALKALRTSYDIASLFIIIVLKGSNDNENISCM